MRTTIRRQASVAHNAVEKLKAEAGDGPFSLRQIASLVAVGSRIENLSRDLEAVDKDYLDTFDPFVFSEDELEEEKAKMENYLNKIMDIKSLIIFTTGELKHKEEVELNASQHPSAFTPPLNSTPHSSPATVTATSHSKTKFTRLPPLTLPEFNGGLPALAFIRRSF